MTLVELQARPPFSFSAVLRSHGWVQMLPFISNSDYSQLTYVLKLHTGKVLQMIVEEAPGGVRVQTNAGLLSEEEEEIAKKVSWMLELDQDLAGFYEMASQEPKLSRAVQASGGRVLRCPTLFEDVVKTILTTNTLWAATLRMNTNLVYLYGDPLEMDPQQHAFPSPARLAALDEESLRADARLGYRAPYVLHLSRAIENGDLELESLKQCDLPTDLLRKQLLAIKGVGNYAAANILMLLGRYDFLPIDSWALKMVSQEWYAGGPVGPAEVEAAFETWGTWKGLAYWFWDWSDQS